jgi:hypothetical protein
VIKFEHLLQVAINKGMPIDGSLCSPTSALITWFAVSTVNPEFPHTEHLAFVLFKNLISS